MGDTIRSFIETVGENQHLAYALVFILSFSESLPLIGSIIPGTTIIIGIAALVASGAVNIWWLLGAAIVGAIGGDGFSYWLGHRYHEKIVAIWPFSRYPQLVEAGRGAIEKHGGKSIFIARFTPAIRAIVPLVAGILRMPPGRFYVVNVISAVAWAIAHIVPAVIAGASLALAGAVGGRLLVLIVAVVAVLWLMLILVRFALSRGVPLIARGLLRLWHWARHHDNWVSREVLSLLDPRHHETKGLLLLIVVLALATWALFGTLRELVAGDPLARADQAVLNVMQGMRSIWGDRAMVAIAELGDSAVTGALFLAVALWLALRRAWRTLGYWVGAAAFALLFVELLRLILHLPRPLVAYRGVAMLGLPSSTMAVTATVYGFLALMIGRELKPAARSVLASGVTLLIALIAFASLYLGVRWISGVLAGLTFALAWIAGLGVVYLSHCRQAIKPGGLMACCVVVFLSAGAFNGLSHFRSDARGYAVRTPPVTMTAEAWWQGGWATLPARRIDLAGGLEEPITLQWAGSVEALEARLAARGWRRPPDWSLLSALGWLQPATGLDDLPVLTRLHNGRPTRLILVRPSAPIEGHPARLILRLWRSNVEIPSSSGAPERLWLGAVIEQRLFHLGDFLQFGLPLRDENAPRARLEAALAPVKPVTRTTVGANSFGWNGWVLLGHDEHIPLPGP